MSDRAVQIRAVLILAKTRGRAWLVSEQERVALAMLAGATVVRSLSVEGRTTTADTNMPATELAEILTQALEQYDAEAGGKADDAGGSVLTFRFGPNGIPY